MNLSSIEWSAIVIGVALLIIGNEQTKRGPHKITVSIGRQVISEIVTTNRSYTTVTYPSNYIFGVTESGPVITTNYWW